MRYIPIGDTGNPVETTVDKILDFIAMQIAGYLCTKDTKIGFVTYRDVFTLALVQKQQVDDVLWQLNRLGGVLMRHRILEKVNELIKAYPNDYERCYMIDTNGDITSPEFKFTKKLFNTSTIKCKATFKIVPYDT